MKLKKRILSLLLCGAMLFSLCSQSVLAEENGQAGGVTIGTSGLCEHHPEHNADCGYTEGTAGTPCVHEHTADCYEEVTNCVHEHDEDCYPEESVSGNEATPSGAQKREPENCPHICDEESGCITKELNCQHEHDDECGYSPATAGTPCGYVCELCGSEDSEKLATPSNAEAVTVASVQAMIDGLPNAEEITEDNAEEVKAQLDAIDEAKEKLSDEEIDELDMTRYAEAAAALGALAAPMLLANDSPDEQFSLTPGDTYYFDLSGEDIPGTANSGNSDGAVSLPDTSLHYVPFTYVGTIEAYKLTSATVTTEEYAQQNKYPHSLFVADYAVTHTVSWDDLNTKSLIFGKNYASGGVDYTLRAPSVGSNSTGSGESQHDTPSNNEWDRILDKNSGYIQNWNKMYSWGQDTSSAAESFRAYRGYNSARSWYYTSSSFRNVYLGFRPVLEVPKPDTLGTDGLKVVTLDLNGGKLGGSSDAIQIIVKNGSTFTAPASDGLNRPDENTGSYFMWLGSDGKLYAPGAIVPAEVTNLTAQFALSEQFSLAPGYTYYFDLSAMGIPGTVNTGNENGAVSLPDTSLHYVPFTYAGTIEAYKLTSATATTEEYAQNNKYAHSLFVADYAVTHAVRWNGLNDEGLIFGKNYASGGVDYTLRAPSVGSDATGLGDSDPGVPQSNEWDTMLNKDSGYIQNWNEMFSWGQDTVSFDASRRAVRGYNSARLWRHSYAARSYSNHGFRPVLEVRNPNTLGPDGLKAVTLALGGGKLGGSSDAIHIIVKTGSEFTAPASDGLNRPDGNTGSYFMWLGSDGKLYAPGASVPADVTKLTAQFALSEQFSLKPGGRYYFDLSGEKIPGTANGNLPDSTLHYVPFTYAGTIEAYKLTSAMATTEEYAQREKYPHSLFVADYTVTHTVSWDDLNTAGLIFGKDYAAGGVDYTLRAPSVGSNSTGLGDSRRGVPQSNEWDAVLNKNSGYIQNWNRMYLWGQDVSSVDASYRARRGYSSARNWYSNSATDSNPILGFRPVLEVLNAETLGSDGLKVVTLDLGGGTLGNSSEDIQIIVKTGSEFTAPASDGMTRPDGNTGSYFMWLGSNGNSYAPGGSVPADVTELTVQWTAPTYAVTLNTNGGTINNGNVTSYTYGVGATLPTDVTRTGYTFKGWYYNENLTGSPVTAISNIETGNKEYWAKWEANAYTVTLNTNGGTINSGNVTEYTYGVGATLPTAGDMTYTGHTFVGWYDNENLTGSPVTAIGSTETGNKEYWAKWEANTYTVTFYPNGGSVNPVAATTDSSGKLSSLPTPTRGGNYRFDGWYTEQTGGIKVTLNQVYTADTTLYAYWIYTSDSSSSEDRDDPSGNAFITDRPNKDNPTTQTTAKPNSVKVDSKGNAVITRSIVADVISVAQSDSIKHGNTKNGIAVVVPVEISKALAGVQITLKADALDKLVSSGVKRFTIDTDSMADFGFMLDTLKELNRQTTGDLILKIKKTAVTSQEVETAIGNRPVYDITLWEVKNGKETQIAALNGKTISIAIPYTPAKDEQTGNLYAVYVDGNGKVQWLTKSSYNMDQKAVIFVAEHFSIYGIGYKNQIPAFTDVNNHWAKDNMLFVVSRGLLSGTSATTFSPNTGMTRGMFVTALGRLAGVDPTDYQASMFTDVKEDAYYAPYVNWAAKTGVVSGTTDTAFAPDTNINREQMAVIMKNYATKLGYTIPKTLEVVNFADSAQISSWAKDAVKSMQQAGILAGKTNNCFDPAGTATRAEVATVLRRFVEIVIDPQTANGWGQNDSGEWSYYKNGDLVKGWLSNDQKWYWLDKNTGKMFSGGWKQIDGKQYYFYADGSMAVNTTVDGKTIGADGARK